jgi:hypothetical protein
VARGASGGTSGVACDATFAKRVRGFIELKSKTKCMPIRMAGGTYMIQFSNKVTKLIHLRNVSSVSLQNKLITIYYNFPCVTGESYYEKVESKPAYDSFEMPTHGEAQKEFEKIQKTFCELA